MRLLQSGKLLSGDWWSPVVSGRSKRSTASTRWGWTLLSEWPCMQTGSQPDHTPPRGIDRQYPAEGRAKWSPRRTVLAKTTTEPSEWLRKSWNTRVLHPVEQVERLTWTVKPPVELKRPS